jgi:uncharacterized protein (DUF1800 family)
VGIAALFLPIQGAEERQMRRKKSTPIRTRIDAPGAALLAAILAAFLGVLFALDAPGASADKNKKKSAADPPTIVLDKKFKGHLPITQLTEDEAILHALDRLAYGPRPGDVEHIRKIGLEKWVNQQLNPGSTDDSAFEERLSSYPTLAMSPEQLLATFPEANRAALKEGITKEEYQQQMKDKQRDAAAQVKTTGNENLDKANQQLAKLQGPPRMLAELSMAKLDRAVYSQRQLEAIMEDFWFNHFNVFGGKGDDRWLLTYYVRDTIRPNTMGKFQDLLIATAKSPAMLFYLDNWMSADPVAFQKAQQAKNGGNHARYQGAFESGMPPTPGTFPAPTMDPNAPQQQMRKQQARQERGLNENYGREVMELHTVGVDAGYTQQDVIAMANCLTGWTIREPRKDPEFVFKPEFHTEGKKVVMGHTFDYGGMKDGEEALKMLANDPHTAKFISTKLARHFVSDNPPPALIDRMVKNYESTGGDIRSLLKTMIYSPEFWSKAAYRAKVKTPFELVASTARALGADLQVSLPLTQWVGRMGEPLFLCQPPTGYSDKAETWVNTGALLNRLNFAMSFAGDHVPGADVQLSAMFGQDASTDPNMALTRAIDIFLDGQIAQGTRETLEARLADPQILRASLDDPVKHVNEGLISGLVLGAPEFQRR